MNFGTGFAILGLAVFFCPFLRKNAINRKNAALQQAGTFLLWPRGKTEKLKKTF